MSDIKYNRIDEDLQQKIISNRESHWINPYAFKDEMAVRRNNDIDKANLWRPVFVRDVEKIMHLPYYNRYANIESSRNENKIDAVLVRASSIKGLKIAYPNYFADIHEFIDIVNSYL